MDGIRNQRSSNDKHLDGIEQGEINLFDCVRVVLKYRRMILLIFVVAVVTTAIVSLVLPKTYSATASVVPPVEILREESELAWGLGAGESSILRKAIGVGTVAGMYAGILRSRAVVDAIIEKYDLMTAYEVKGYKSKARKKLMNNTSISVSEQGIVTVTVEDKDPNRAAAIANTYVDELDQQNKRLSSGQATSKRIFLESRLKEIERDLSQIENLLSREAKIKEMLFELLSREFELAKIAEAKSMPTIQILDKALVPEKKSKPRRRMMVGLSAIVALFGAVFVAFSREFFARMKEVETRGQSGPPFELAGEGDTDSGFAELESKRKIVATQRRRRGQESQAYSQEAQRL